jgi:hypothetical protein
MRRRRGQRFWKPHYDRLLGTDLDRVIARKLKCSVTTEMTRRNSLGIPPFREQSKPSDEFIALLGTMPDVHLANLRGVSHQAIHLMRLKHGIPAFVRPLRDRSGQTVGEATIVSRVRGENRYVVRCRCGRTFEREWPLHTGNPVCGMCGSSRGENLTGRTWNFLTAVEYVGNRDGKSIWLFRCAPRCGKTKEINAYNVVRGLQRSCGCLRPGGS